MKTNISFFSILIMYSTTLLAQKKDSLFFAIDKYYTISPTITTNLNNQTRSELIQAQKKQRTYTKTNGYVYFIGDGILIKGLKPKKILSLKDYIENRKFYYDGKYNQIVDKWKLEDYLTDKYEIFFVNGKEFIQPRYLEYISYYREGLISKPIKDTLCFTLDQNYIYQSKHNNDIYLFKEAEELYFKKVAQIGALKPNKILNFESYIHSSKFYDKTKKRINDFNLTVYLGNYIIFLINKKDEEIEYIEVSPVYAIE
jgi:hypothetical protein